MRDSMKMAALVLALLAPGRATAASDGDIGQMNKAVQAYNGGDYVTSAFLFYDLADNASVEDVRLKSEYYLAQSFFKKGLVNAALRQYAYVMKAGPNHPYYLKAVEGLVNVSEALREDFVTGTVLDKEYNDEFAKLATLYPDGSGIEILNKINFIVGVVSYRKNKRDDAVSFLTSVPADSSYFARARYLLGVLYARNGENDKALGAFEDVLKLKSAGKVTYVDLDEIRQLGTLGLARVYFGMGRYADSVKYYESVGRFSEYWDEALFENGWARFQNDDYGGALGSLQALHAPQFAGSFQPESWVLKATVYYFSCLYDDAKSALDGFEKVYLPIVEKLKPILDSEKGNEHLYALLAAESDKLPRSVKNFLVANKRLVGFKRYIDRLSSEKEAVSAVQTWRGSRLQNDLVQALDQSRAGAVQMAGNFVKKRLDDAVARIVGFDSRKEVIRFEVAKAETQLLETGVDQKKYLASQDIWRPVMPGDGWEYWQFQGEFWLDEIGYYQYTLKAGCVRRDE